MRIKLFHTSQSLFVISIVFKEKTTQQPKNPHSKLECMRLPYVKLAWYLALSIWNITGMWHGAMQLMVIPSSNWLLSYRRLHLHCWGPIAQLESSWFLNIKSMCSLMVSEAVLALEVMKIHKESWRSGKEKQEFDLYRQISSPAPIFCVDKIKRIFQEKSHLPITLMHIQKYLLQAVTTNLGRF